ncbi:MAG: hypothetical protein KatS3mg001_242 [Candidatus Pacearchaeota archaeon]|nr:MAG: hypothetical protein KatS3mg001_242 [Candidatus Pacearchaeota archaeon]
MGWKTFLIMYFKAGNEKASEIVKKVESLGFECTIGPVDFVYDWRNKVPTKEDILELADKLVKVLDGTGVMFNIDTHETPD